MKRFAAMLAVSVLMVLWIASGDRMSSGQRTDGSAVTGIHPDAVLIASTPARISRRRSTCTGWPMTVST